MRSSSALVLLGLLTTSVTFAATPPPSPATRSRASALLKEGAKLLDRKEFSAALSKFQAAYALVPSPKILFNVGLAEQGRDRPAAAHRAFAQYLQEATTDAAERRTEALQHLDVLAGQVLTVTVQTPETDATITLDGEDQGTTPLRHPLVVEPGSHAALIRNATGLTWSQNIRGAAGATLTLRPTFVAPVATFAPPPVSPPPVRLPAVASAAPTPRTPDPMGVSTPTPLPPNDSLFRHPWFWIGAGAVIAGGITAAVLLSRGGGGTCTDCPGTLISAPGTGKN